MWGDSFWSDGYFYRSVGSTTTAESVQYYVQNTQRKRWMNYDDYETAKQEKEKEAQARLTDY
jgi:hypothetical protein